MSTYKLFCIVLLLQCCTLLLGDISLRCSKSENYDEYNIDTKVIALYKLDLIPTAPYVYDMDGNKYTASHLSVASLSKIICSFTLKNFIVSAEGAIFQASVTDQRIKPITSNQVLIDYTHPDNVEGSYFEMKDNVWTTAMKKLKSKFKNPTTVLSQYKHVVPLRLPWDSFTHITIQHMPQLGLAYTLYQSKWNQLVFHCNTYSAALVNLLGVPLKNIILAKTIFAKQVLFPWIPHWIPIHNAPTHGISNITHLLTQNLLAKQFNSELLQSIKRIDIKSPSHADVIYESLLSPTDPYRYIIYFSRANQATTKVYKEQELLAMITKVINKSKYRLIVVGFIHDYGGTNVIKLQASWQQIAQLHSKTIIMMGPHGGSWNNMIFNPSDCHYIEFNHFPEEKINKTVIRSVLLNSFHAQGGTGKFYHIDPNKVIPRSNPDMYYSPYMKISQRDVLKVLIQINKDIPNHDLLTDNVNILDAPELSKEDITWKSDTKL